MADTKISALTAKTGMNLTDELLVNEAGVSKKVDFDDLSLVGSFTPALTGSTTAGSHTYGQNRGNYLVIGRHVTFSIYIDVTTYDAATAGDIRLTGLPYAVSSGFTFAQFPAAIGRLRWVTLSSGYTAMAKAQDGQSYVQLYETDGLTDKFITASQLASGFIVNVAGSYIRA